MAERIVYVDVFDPRLRADDTRNLASAKRYARLRVLLCELGRADLGDDSPADPARLPAFTPAAHRIELAALHGILLADGRREAAQLDRDAVDAALIEYTLKKKHFDAVHAAMPPDGTASAGERRIETRVLATIARRFIALHDDPAAIDPQRLPAILEQISTELNAMTNPIQEVYPDVFDKDLAKQAQKPLPPQTDPAYEERLAQQREALDKLDRQKRLYLSVRHLLLDRFGFPTDKPLPDTAAAFPGAGGSELTDDQKAYFVAVHGLLQADGYDDPELRAEGNRVPGSLEGPRGDAGRDYLIVPRFVAAVVEAVQEFQAHKALFLRVFRELRREGCKLKNGGVAPQCDESTIRTRQVALVTRRIVELEIDPDDPQIRRHIIEALALALRGRVDGSASGIVIDLPDLDLDEGHESDIHRDNVVALSAIYYTAMLEEMKLFAVADRVVEQFQAGMLPVSRGLGGDRMYRYYREAVNRFTEAERRSLYARAFGLAQGSVDEPLPNREFSDLWIRFLSAVSLFKRQAVEERKLVHPQQVFKSARDLAVNLSLHGYGIAHFAAVELQRLVRDVVQMLSHPDVLNAYGAFHIWQLVDRVSGLYLGGAVNGVQHRTMAHSGANIIKWLGEHARLLSSPFTRSLRDTFPDDELVDYVERWLAVTGTNDQTVEQFSEPIVAPQQLTIPSLQLPNLGQMQSMSGMPGMPGMPGNGQLPDAMRGAMNRVGNLMPSQQN